MLCWFPLDNNVHSSTVYNSQDVGSTWMSFSGRMDTEVVAHICSGILLCHRKEIIRVHCSEVEEHTVYYKE